MKIIILLSTIFLCKSLSPSEDIAYKIAFHQQQIFNSLTVSSTLKKNELVRVFQTYHFPVPFQTTVEEYLDSYSSDINLTEFGEILNNLWNVNEFNKAKDYESGLLQIKRAILKLWEFFDYEGLGVINSTHLEQGVSYIMGKDVRNFEQVWKKSDMNQDGFLDFKEFSMAIFNRIIFDTYMKDKGMLSFLKSEEVKN